MGGGDNKHLDIQGKEEGVSYIRTMSDKGGGVEKLRNLPDVICSWPLTCVFT